MLTAVTGINWGDEGKGRVIDLLAEHADIVARYQGGNNAGHTVVTEKGKFILNLLPSGILHPDVTCVLGTGMVIDLDHLANEMQAIDEIKLDVDNDPHAAYFDQVHNGVYIRMAIILALLGIPDPLTGKKVLEC